MPSGVSAASAPSATAASSAASTISAMAESSEMSEPPEPAEPCEPSAAESPDRPNRADPGYAEGSDQGQRHSPHREADRQALLDVEADRRALVDLEADRRALRDLVIYAYDRTTSGGVRARLVEGLAAIDIQVVSPEGEPFDPARHEVGGTESTDDPGKHDTVAETELAGFTDHGTVIREPIVVVYRLP